MTLAHFLSRARVTDEFREALTQFARSGRANDRVRFGYHSPAIKVERTLTRALEQYPELPVDAVEVEGSSGCEYYRGTLTLFAGEEVRRIRFEWNCKWRAEQMGWRDYFGFADQARAAREFGYDCFRAWAEEPALEAAAG